MASYYNTTISLSVKEKKRVDALKKKGIGIIDIFRVGMSDVEARLPKKLF